MTAPGSANVRSLEAIRDFRVALVLFEERAARAVGGLRQEIQRVLDWLEHDRPAYWKRQVLRTYDEVASARVNLENCRRRTIADFRPSCIDEERAFRRAQQRLRTAQDQIEVVRRWSARLQQEMDEYRGRVSPFERSLESELPEMLALLRRIIETVELYADHPAAAEQTSPEPGSEESEIRSTNSDTDSQSERAASG